MFGSTKVVWLVLGLLFVAGTASALEGVTVDAEQNLVGKYIWRGKVLTDDYALQPSITLGMEQLSFQIWGSMDLTNWNGENNPLGAGEYRDKQEFREVEYILDYTDTLPDYEGVNYSLGTILYHFPTTNGSGNATTEIYGGLGFETTLNPTVMLYYDVDDADGFYGNVGVSHSLDISEYGIMDDLLTSVDLAAGIGYGSSNYNQHYWGDSVESLNDFVISATVPIELCSRATLKTSCNYVSLLDNSLDKNESGTRKSQKSDYVYFGVGVAVTF